MESQRTYTAPDPAPGAAKTEAFGAGRHAPENGNGHHAPADAFKDLGARLAELKEYAGLYVAAKADGVKLTLRKLVIYAALGVVGLVAGLTFLVTASVYLLSGLAGAIGEIFPQPYEAWGGRLVVGVLVLGGTVGGVLLIMKSLTGSSRKRTIEKYENRKRFQRELFGHDVRDRACEQVQNEQR